MGSSSNNSYHQNISNTIFSDSHIRYSGSELGGDTSIETFDKQIS